MGGALSARRCMMRWIFVLAKNVADYRHADPNARRLLQVADYVCTVLRVSEDCMMLAGNRRPMSGFSAIAGISLSRLKSSSIEGVCVGLLSILWLQTAWGYLEDAGELTKRIA
ncbi:MAG: hypothetical protein ACLTSX_13945 [Collinsella sp.]